MTSFRISKYYIWCIYYLSLSSWNIQFLYKVFQRSAIKIDFSLKFKVTCDFVCVQCMFRCSRTDVGNKRKIIKINIAFSWRILLCKLSRHLHDTVKNVVKRLEKYMQCLG